MKKIIYLTMIIISLAMCLCGCTKKNQEGQLSKIYKVPQKLIYINAPNTYEETQNITGVITEKEQNEESIQEIKSLVDEMARTVRNTKDNIMD